MLLQSLFLVKWFLFSFLWNLRMAWFFNCMNRMLMFIWTMIMTHVLFNTICIITIIMLLNAYLFHFSNTIFLSRFTVKWLMIFLNRKRLFNLWKRFKNTWTILSRLLFFLWKGWGIMMTNRRFWNNLNSMTNSNTRLLSLFKVLLLFLFCWNFLSSRRKIIVFKFKNWCSLFLELRFMQS